MSEYIILSDSTNDLPASYLNNKDLAIIPMEFLINGKEYKNYLDHKDMPIKEFYDLMRNGAIGKTNQINVARFLDKYEELYKMGNDILVIAFSSALSGTYNSAILARNTFIEEHPDAKIEVVDSKCASMGEGLLVHYALEAKKKGMSLIENKKYVEGLVQKISHWFTVDDIDTLKRGGRLSGGAAFVAKTLKIKPVLYVSPEGKLIARMKKIGRKNSLNSLVEKFKELYIPEENPIVFISHGDSLEDAIYVKEEIEKQTGITNFVINEIGPVIGSHSGPGTVAVFFISKER